LQTTMRKPLHIVLPSIVLILAVYSQGSTRLLIVDAGHTDTGDTCLSILAAIPNVEALKKVDAAQLPAAATESWDAIIWISPEPTLYKNDRQTAWKTLVNKTPGLLVIGLPHDKPGRKELFDLLSQRGGPQLGIHLEKHVEGAFWIWGPKTKDEQHVYLRKSFDLKDVPTRAWIQCNADNAAQISVNGAPVGSAD